MTVTSKFLFQTFYNLGTMNYFKNSSKRGYVFLIVQFYRFGRILSIAAIRPGILWNYLVCPQKI